MVFTEEAPIQAKEGSQVENSIYSKLNAQWHDEVTSRQQT